MGYVLLAVMFYTVVRFGTDVWLQLRDEKMGDERYYEYGQKLRLLDNRVTILEEN